MSSNPDFFSSRIIKDPYYLKLYPNLPRKQLFLRLYFKYGNPIARGRNRIVFQGKNNVFKFPRNDDGVLENVWEAKCYKESKNDSFWKNKLAHCKCFDFFLNVMEIVEIPKFKDAYDSLPGWVYSVDCAQVGYNKKGDLVAYDYGNN